MISTLILTSTLLHYPILPIYITYTHMHTKTSHTVLFFYYSCYITFFHFHIVTYLFRLIRILFFLFNQSIAGVLLMVILTIMSILSLPCVRRSGFFEVSFAIVTLYYNTSVYMSVRLSVYLHATVFVTEVHLCMACWVNMM